MAILTIQLVERGADRVAIGGKTYPVRKELRALGGEWDDGAQKWLIPIEREEEARQIVRDQKAAPRASVLFDPDDGSDS